MRYELTDNEWAAIKPMLRTSRAECRYLARALASLPRQRAEFPRD